MRKNGTKVQKRTLQLNDMAGRSVELTLWGWLQTICHAGEFPVLATKVVRSNDFNGNLRRDLCSKERSGSCSGETIKRKRGFDLERPTERDIFYGGCDEHEAGLTSYTALERCKISSNNDDGYDEDVEVDLTLSIGGGSQVNINKNRSCNKPYLLPLGYLDSPNGKTKDLNSSVSFQSYRVGDFSDPTTPMSSSSVTFDQERKGPHWISQGLKLK
ncbi:uncharacterized protein [Glycine max]|uniref:uncharacterized protein n=1 Tax=Glycine max TaxID=3847 RepID=UPI000E21BCF7|nr:uncharacterized protein LOC100802606 [Glycine max]|eukprot:XP_025983193.1 uncharacterized protein LOC100802606 [Glycine max]